MVAAVSRDLPEPGPGVDRLQMLGASPVSATRWDCRAAWRSGFQPNHPTDDLKGIAAAILDGLLYGCGDAVIGINPATDNLEVTRGLLEMISELIQRYQIPTQSCVLAHVTTSIRAIEVGAPIDLVFQSIAGTEAANKSFGINLALLAEAHQAALSLHRGTIGNNCMYFRTGQGEFVSPLTPTMAWISKPLKRVPYLRLRRKFKPLLVNTVVGFIGPEISL